MGGKLLRPLALEGDAVFIALYRIVSQLFALEGEAWCSLPKLLAIQIFLKDSLEEKQSMTPFIRYGETQPTQGESFPKVKGITSHSK